MKQIIIKPIITNNFYGQPSSRRPDESGRQKSKRCFICNSPNHLKRDCRNKESFKKKITIKKRLKIAKREVAKLRRLLEATKEKAPQLQEGPPPPDVEMPEQERNNESAE
ncbi:uncharacterized protein LOC126909617 [Daktulosphaira vitifoliae]|uniref:uncharacterized protein LOC126909617 n=1 Tax=Daktulosphaira vitifoliae TaxID=58002 RepID=UPI0021A999C9|nr:uncharacterized protein LOC126909617 [Daktulosphaira vitifoliae]